MIISCKRFGQLGNQLYTLANQIAVAKEYKIRGGVLYLNFGYMELFPNIKKISGAKVYHCPKVARLLGACLHILSIVSFRTSFFRYHNQKLDDAGKAVKNMLSKHELDGLNVVSGFPFYEYDALCKNHNYIAWCFEFQPEVIKKVSKFVEQYREDADYLIGIHIRRGDYKEWRGGKYYFDDAAYYAASQAIQDVLQLRSKKVKYVICSNEEINLDHYDGKYERYVGDSMEHDMYMLSLCDCIVAPQSTFSGWASFLGRVPVFRIRPEKKIPDSKDDLLIQFFETDGAGKRR